MKVYDLIILGGGPAAITAAIYAKRKKIDFLVITKDIGGQVVLSGDIQNYTGFEFITGANLAIKFKKHLQSLNIPVNKSEGVTGIEREKGLIKTHTRKSVYFSKSLIVATGKRPKKLNTEGEDEFKNKGVSYCATCDGLVFKGQNVVVVGGGNSALDAVLQMMRISPKVYLINRSPLRADPVMVKKAESASNVEIWTGALVKKISGGTFVRAIDVEKDGKIHKLKVEGVFVEIGLIPNSDFAEILTCNETGEIVVDSFNRTNVEGIFAAGDVTNVSEKQIIISCGEGAKTSLTVFKYLARL